MGNTLTQEEQTLSDSLQQQYFFQSNQFLVHKATQRPCTLHRISTFSKQQSASVERNIAEYYQAKCNSISKIKQHYKLDNSGYCSDQQKFYLVFDGHNSPNAKEEYFSRRYTGQGFSHDEIQSILSCMLCGIRHYYQVFNRKESRISLESVCIDRYNNNNLWIKDPWLVQKQNDIGQLPINFLATYPSPEKIQASNFANIDFNEYKSDLFSIGIFGLQFLNMNYRDDLYVHKKFVDRQRVGESLNAINNPRLRGGIGILLSEDPDQRSKIFRYWQIQCSKTYRINSVRSDNLRFSSVNTNMLSNASSNNNPHFAQQHPNYNLHRSQVKIPTFSPPKQVNQIFWRPQISQLGRQHQITIIQPPIPKQFNKSAQIKNNYIQPQSKRLNIEEGFRKKSQTIYYQDSEKLSQSQKRVNSNTTRVNFQSTSKDNTVKKRVNQNINIHIPPKKIPPSQQNKMKQAQPQVHKNKTPQSFQMMTSQMYQNQYMQSQMSRSQQQNSLKKSYQTPKFNYQSPYFNSQTQNSGQNKNLYYGSSQKTDPMLNSFNLYGSTQKQPQQTSIPPYQPQQHPHIYYNNTSAANPIMTQSILNSHELKENNSNSNSKHPKISNEDHTNANSSNNQSISLRQTKKVSQSARNSSSFNYLPPTYRNQPISTNQNGSNFYNQIKKQATSPNNLTNNSPFQQNRVQMIQKNQKVDLSLINNNFQTKNKNQSLVQVPSTLIKKFSPQPSHNLENIPTSPSSVQIPNPSPSPHQVTPPPAIRNPNKYNSTIVQVNEETPNQSSQSENQNQGDIQFIVEEYETGSRYEGFKKNGLRHGRGKFFYQDGGYYDGEWKKNQMHGWGKLFYQGGQLAYEGNWAHDQFHGYGKVYNDNPVKFQGGFDYTNFDLLDDYWEFYQGMLANDTKQGRGRIQLTNKQVFQGDFHTDRIQGFGKFLRRDGTIVQGIWRDSRLMKILNSNDIYR